MLLPYLVRYAPRSRIDVWYLWNRACITYGPTFAVLHLVDIDIDQSESVNL